MYTFTNSGWSEQASQRKRERLAIATDAELRKELEAAEYMCSPRAYWGEGPRECYLIQRELVREEIWRREERIRG